MSVLKKIPLEHLGYDFIPNEFLQEGQDEYTLRFQQNPRNDYRDLTADEIQQLIANGNWSSDWSRVKVSAIFDPKQIQHCKFYGLVRIGNLSPSYLEYRNLKLPIGLYHSTIISSDFGDDVAVHHIGYLSYFIVGNEVLLSQIKEMETGSTAKFGNGILRDGEESGKRIQLELCNENGARSVYPFDGMQAADVYLWTRNRHDRELQHRFEELTDQKFGTQRGYYSQIGDRCVIKNTFTIKNVKIGTDAYIKGVNKLKNVTVNSSQESYTQIGEGCELVNGIIGYGCRIFYGVKAVRFILASYSQLKYGARLINSYLGDNSTISCCEVLNSLIFPAHEQHHNNSFLCAALVMGQSNMAAGATVGSNHNSRAADGEIIAGRGFWPGLCVSLKHNSRFASYCLIVKGDFLHELDIQLPFTLVSNDVQHDRLVLIPGYWFMYNMYALVRNANKYEARDNRHFKNQYFEYDMLAPDTVNEMFAGMETLAFAVSESLQPEENKTRAERIVAGRALLANNIDLKDKTIVLSGAENSRRPTVIQKVGEAYHLYRSFIKYYGVLHLMEALEEGQSLDEIFASLATAQRTNWENIGGQLIESTALQVFLDDIKSKEIDSWDDIHEFYHERSKGYPLDKRKHALLSLIEILHLEGMEISKDKIVSLLDQALGHRIWIGEQIYKSRAKDYKNPFKNMVYANEEERDIVVGKLAENAFINQQQNELELFKIRVANLKGQF
ncbi:DUF4954 domain-containing protein [Sphingobacterium sp. CZ-UAM]|uniref:DUF4954 family protein n=1 Tax=Sphingobacterium sp. CZ-UAM TaxID=1933868 RepID=UPI00098709E2|nr:DUF4954 family protein [Sphingobacterium sp. CZ-UAM]OOG19857.1 DUF4954 domain-containing protein [Sphingobacterium sp. CZ-UAM]